MSRECRANWNDAGQWNHKTEIKSAKLMMLMMMVTQRATASARQLPIHVVHSELSLLSIKAQARRFPQLKAIRVIYFPHIKCPSYPFPNKT